MKNMEEARRELRQRSPELYQYIAAIESARALDVVADTLRDDQNTRPPLVVTTDLISTYRKRAAVLQVATPIRRR
jgi:hypothetical protein